MTSEQTLLTKKELQPATSLLFKLLSELDKLLFGRSNLHKLVLVGIFSSGHILLEGLPGLGKTALVKALGQLLNLKFTRIQFTPDLMPGDILGTPILQENENGKRKMTFQKGPIFTNILLADEINRASPKTQSALLEAMEEHSVTILGETYPLPEPFIVLASQNPIEMEGVYPLPEAQLDRFLFKINVSQPQENVLNDIIIARRHGKLPTPTWTLKKEELNLIYNILERMYLPQPVAKYISKIVAATHPNNQISPEIVRDYVAYGASPRAAIALAETARCIALFENRPTTGFEDVKAVITAVLNHRIILNYKATFDHKTSTELIQQLINSIDQHDLSLPADIIV